MKCPLKWVLMVDLKAEFYLYSLLFPNFQYSLLSIMIKIRLQRHGARHAPFYRMVVAPAQSRRDGRFIEVLGTYNPQSSARERELDLKMDRIDHWLDVGAQPTDTAKSLIRQGRLSPEDWLKRTEAKASAKGVRAAKKKNPAPVAEAPAEDAPAEEVKEEKAEAPAEEAPAEEVKEEKAEAPAEEAKAEEAPAAESKEESPAEETAPEVESKEEAPAKEAKKEKPITESKKAAKAKPKKTKKAEDKKEAGE